MTHMYILSHLLSFCCFCCPQIERGFLSEITLKKDQLISFIRCFGFVFSCLLLHTKWVKLVMIINAMKGRRKAVKYCFILKQKA